jgi:group I intron endonuclease
MDGDIMSFYVYKITNTINDKLYIGQTTESLKERFNRHKGYQLEQKCNSKIHRAMKKYGSDKFNIHLIEECSSQEELNEREYYWIHKLNTINEGYNINDSGKKCGGDTWTNNPNKEIISKKLSETKMGENNPNSVKIKAINIITKEEKIYGSIMDCCRDLDIKGHANITRRLEGKTKSPYKKKYIFEKIDSKEKRKGNSVNSKPVIAKNLKTKESFEFNSISECVKKLDLKTHSNVYKILNNKTNKPYLNIWWFEYK